MPEYATMPHICRLLGYLVIELLREIAAYDCPRESACSGAEFSAGIDGGVDAGVDFSADDGSEFSSAGIDEGAINR